MKPLEGVNVLEFSTMITASFAAMMLAEQGARVIKVEPLELGDPMRFLGSSKGGISALFANCNRGKQSLRINIKDDEGRKVIEDLVDEIDRDHTTLHLRVPDEARLDQRVETDSGSPGGRARFEQGHQLSDSEPLRELARNRLDAVARQQVRHEASVGAQARPPHADPPVRIEGVRVEPNPFSGFPDSDFQQRQPTENPPSQRNVSS